jgi:hypothetical protein
MLHGKSTRDLLCTHVVRLTKMEGEPPAPAHNKPRRTLTQPSRTQYDELCGATRVLYLQIVNKVMLEGG